MGKRRYTPEQVIRKLREVEVLISQGTKTPQVARQIKSEDVLITLTDLFVRRGTPTNIRSDNGSEFTAHIVREWLGAVGVNTLFITPGSPWENDYNESINGKLRDEVLNVEIFDNLLEAQVLINRWKTEYNHIRPHSSLGYKPLAPEAHGSKSIMNNQSKQLRINS